MACYIPRKTKALLTWRLVLLKILDAVYWTSAKAANFIHNRLEDTRDAILNRHRLDGWDIELREYIETFKADNVLVGTAAEIAPDHENDPNVAQAS